MPALMAVVLTAGLAGAVKPAPAFADSSFMIAAAVDLTADMRDTVWKLSYNRDMPPELQAAAYVAFESNDDAKIRAFIRTGYSEAMRRAKAREDSNAWYIGEIHRTSIPGSEVNGSSGEAKIAKSAAQEEYVQSGYARAQELDRLNDNKRQERLARLVKEDRDYVARLAADDPGLQVRALAQSAINGDDRSVALFFKYYWKIGADLDQERFIRSTLQQNVIWQDRIRLLTDSALAAEKAERESSGELARKYRQDAKNAWEQIDREAGQSSVDWLAEKGKADAQAAAWARIAEHARNAQSEQDWAEVLRRATESNTSWADEVRWAQGEAAKWLAIAEQARKAAKDAVERDLGDR
ncbi:hypothetical protein ABZX92_01105 [Lentzea sp. NPDC006480]|uniref:hypothetical protein n=1 Tax=Lentzea sp. NPDC006480 TaxID=3157176 RepID=UPI0033B9958B